MPDIRFWSASGSEHMQLFGGTDTLENIGQEISNYAVGAPADTVNRLGFFGATGPGSPVIVNSYQSTTYSTDDEGDLHGPPFVQLKYVGSAATVQVSGAWTASTQEVGFQSGTLMIRFTEPTATAVQVQNAYLEALKLNANEYAAQNDQPDNLIVRAFECQHPDGLSITNDTWVQLAGAGATGEGSANNQLALTDQPQVAIIHDYCVAISVSPEAAGQNIAHGYYVQLEYL